MDTIPRLNRGKKDLFLFFQGAGVDRRYSGEAHDRWQHEASSINKNYGAIARHGAEMIVTGGPRRGVHGAQPPVPLVFTARTAATVQLTAGSWLAGEWGQQE